MNVYSTSDWMLGVAFRAKYKLLKSHFNKIFLKLKYSLFFDSNLPCLVCLNSLLTKGLAGIQAVNVPGIENVGTNQCYIVFFV